MVVLKIMAFFDILWYIIQKNLYEVINNFDVVLSFQNLEGIYVFYIFV